MKTLFIPLQSDVRFLTLRVQQQDDIFSVEVGFVRNQYHLAVKSRFGYSDLFTFHRLEDTNEIITDINGLLDSIDQFQREFNNYQ